ncbi:MAG TPA: hypothetical protein VLG28_14770 [Acidimicrobiia bacterium]|nr:hypothetical protein [Acidimicrobiia bacterium]
MTIYVFAEDIATEGGDPAMAAVERTVTIPESEVGAEALAAEAVNLLFQGDVPPGYSSAIPPESGGFAFSVQDGVATLDVSPVRRGRRLRGVAHCDRRNRGLENLRPG